MNKVLFPTIVCCSLNRKRNGTRSWRKGGGGRKRRGGIGKRPLWLYENVPACGRECFEVGFMD